jgi:hypothetical protein
MMIMKKKNKKKKKWRRSCSATCDWNICLYLVIIRVVLCSVIRLICEAIIFTAVG